MRDVHGDFPVLKKTVNGHRLVYLDSAATSQKPVQVIEAVAAFYREANANVHRGLYALSVEATDLYEGARHKVAEFIGAAPEEVIFTRGTT
ncbi:TPA: aminotransferase class V-fold PLP-dependent enzyme, partial [Candidatus Micrarchaeota archaeon]|nr:aminotransferase class V-fold PLP-dependent enzyme [Candidatus Micrarchaeota archaeon]